MTKRELIRLAWDQGCQFEGNWNLTLWQMIWFTIKVTICILLGLWSEDAEYDDCIVVASWGMRPTSNPEYSGLDWDDLCVLKNEWAYFVEENSSV